MYGAGTPNKRTYGVFYRTGLKVKKLLYSHLSKKVLTIKIKATSIVYKQYNLLKSHIHTHLV